MICINNWIYNFGKMLSFFERKDRQKPFNSTQRLEEYVHDDNIQKSEETERQQQIAEQQLESQRIHSIRYYQFTDELGKASGIKTPEEMAGWLIHERGYEDNVAYKNNIHRIFEREKEKLRREIKLSEKYAFPKSPLNN